MEHEFVYPIVRPLPPRGIDVAPKSWSSLDASVAATVSPLGRRRPDAGPAGAGVHVFAQPAQTPRMQVG